MVAALLHWVLKNGRWFCDLVLSQPLNLGRKLIPNVTGPLPPSGPHKNIDIMEA